MFEIFPWNSNLETGIDLIDEQHHKLVDLINRLAQQHVQGATEAEVQAILGELGDYADYHFRTEEAIWQTALAGDDWLTRHIETHQRFFAHMVEMQSGQRPFQAVLDDLFSYLIQCWRTTFWTTTSAWRWPSKRLSRAQASRLLMPRPTHTCKGPRPP